MLSAMLAIAACALFIVPAASGARSHKHGSSGAGTQFSEAAGAGVNEHGLRVTLSVDLSEVRVRAPVEIELKARAQHANGALFYTLAYGDGKSAPPVMVPQYCLAGGGRPASGSWHFTHRYRSRGAHKIVARVMVNCGGASAKVAVTVHVSAKRKPLR